MIAFKNLLYTCVILLMIASCKDDQVSLTPDDLMILTTMEPNAAAYDSILTVHKFRLISRDTSTLDDGTFFMNSAYVNPKETRVTIYNEMDKQTIRWLTQSIEYRTAIRSHNVELIEDFESVGFKKIDKFTFKYKDFEVQNVPVQNGKSFLYSLNIYKEAESK